MQLDITNDLLAYCSTKFDVDCWNPKVLRGAAMFIYNMDWAVEYPRPLPPSVQAVGALLPRPAQPLEPFFQVHTLAV